jgi:hypothetical protein
MLSMAKSMEKQLYNSGDAELQGSLALSFLIYETAEKGNILSCWIKT